jgi:hypothetical protein
MLTYKILNTLKDEEDLTREDIVELLLNDVATVTFTKADGTERVMKCTLLQKVLEDRLGIKLETESELLATDVKPVDPVDLPPLPQVNQNIVSVFDIDANGWRSFRLDSIKSIDVLSRDGDGGIIYPTFDTDLGNFDQDLNVDA